MKTLAIMLCLCLLAPVGNAAEVPGRESKRVASVSKSSNPKPAQPLSPEESAELSKRAEEPGADVVGGALSNEHLTYIVIALAAAVLVLVLK